MQEMFMDISIYYTIYTYHNIYIKNIKILHIVHDAENKKTKIKESKNFQVFVKQIK